QIRFKDDEGKEFPEWEIKKLGTVSDVRDGTHDSPKYIQNKGYPLITSKNLMKNGKLDFDNVNLISAFDYEQISRRSGVSVGDILFGMIGTIGNPVIVEQDNFAIKNVALIKEKDKLINRFLIFLLKSDFIENQFHVKNAGGTQKFIALGVIRELDVLFPSLAEQTKIAEFLTAIDAKIAVVSAQVAAAKGFKKGLLQQMFV
ncbi:MAG: restriction endonuclease subunit S, partial [Flavobacterium sp.]